MQNENIPTTSDPRAMEEFPDARRNERDTLIGSVAIDPGDSVLDIQSAGGYLSDEIYRRFNGNIHCICLEPSAELRRRLSAHFTVIDNPVENFFDIGDGSVDVALGLAGLHHSESHQATVSEAFRVLKPGGQLAICDVIEGSDVGRWLNEFVDRNNPAGHKGDFLVEGRAMELLEIAGFQQIEETVRNVPWLFERRGDISRFFKGLFGLECSESVIDSALDDFFSIRECNGRLEIDWPLIYCRGSRSKANDPG